MPHPMQSSNRQPDCGLCIEAQPSIRGVERVPKASQNIGNYHDRCHYRRMDDRYRVVYSTEQGQTAKAMDKPAGRKNRAKPGNQPTVIKKPGKQGVRIRRESKGRGGKSVCVIDGLSLDPGGLKLLLKKLKASLGCGGAVKGDELEIQGNHRETLLLLLEKEGHKAKLAGG